MSIGVAGFPKDGLDANELIHQADLAVYRAKLQGRNRVLGASTEPLLLAAERGATLRAVAEDGEHVTPLAAPPSRSSPPQERRDATEAAHAARADLLPAVDAPRARRRRRSA